MNEATDRREIDALSARFFAAFSVEGALRDGLGVLRELFVAQARIVRAGELGLEFYDLEQFIAPRAELLASGRLQDFVEHELNHRCEIFGNIAQRCSHYAKSGVLDGQAFQGRGVKLMQLVKTSRGWQLSALSWRDEAG
jgi:hypothetical protein